ncbi:MAG TPA: PIN domain-containing protein [Candidatus Acidoferrales bacterium]|jgi:predicted nucleic acid-binding protein|nr:PIN domain-containing protein [Candidatus Acidoferrales bacterium]
MTGLDCNILVQLALADHPANAATVAAIQAEAQRGDRLVFPTLVINEFLHVITDPRRFSPPLTMNEALDWMENFLSNPSVSMIEPAAESSRQTLLWMRQFNLGRKRILDTNLAAIFHAAGVRRLMTSNPADFAVFGVFEVITP